MSQIQIGLAGLAALVILLSLRMPIGLSLVAISFLGISALAGPEVAYRLAATTPFEFSAAWTLSSIPMFLLMGYIAHHAGMIEPLFGLARILLSRLPGGVACASVAGTAGFAAVSGSSVATAAAMGRIAIPEMLKLKYDPGLATGTLAAAGTIGALIPPSIIMILYAVFASVPVSKLFLTGLFLGVITAATYIAVIIARVMLKPSLAPPTKESFSRDRFTSATVGSLPIATVIAIVFGGMFTGVFTATEAGGAGAVAAILIGLSLRRLSAAQIFDGLKDTVTTSAAIFIIAVGASLLTRFMALSGTSQFLLELLAFAEGNHMLLLLVIAGIFVVIGMFLEPIGAMLLTLPIMLPVVDAAGIDLIFFGVFVLKLLEIGVITPPIGMNVFVIRSVVPSSIGLATIFRGVAWFILADTVLIGIMILFPGMITWLI